MYVYSEEQKRGMVESSRTTGRFLLENGQSSCAFKKIEFMRLFTAPQATDWVSLVSNALVLLLVLVRGNEGGSVMIQVIGKASVLQKWTCKLGKYVINFEFGSSLDSCHVTQWKKNPSERSNVKLSLA